LSFFRKNSGRIYTCYTVFSSVSNYSETKRMINKRLKSSSKKYISQVLRYLFNQNPSAFSIVFESFQMMEPAILLNPFSPRIVPNFTIDVTFWLLSHLGRWRMSSGANFEPSRFMQQKRRSGESVFVDCLSETKGAIDAAEVAGIPLRNTDYLSKIAYKIAFYFF
jgi:hypothetical protein